MTRREKLERKLEKRREWAEKRRTKASATLNSNPELRHDWAFITQPGHIPARERINRADDRAIESLTVAAHHESKASGLETQLNHSIYSDDDDAVGALEARIKGNEEIRARMREVNRLYRKKDAVALAALGLDFESIRKKLEEAGPYWGKAPCMPYELSNLGGRITADKKRLDCVKRERVERAEAEEPK